MEGLNVLKNKRFYLFIWALEGNKLYPLSAFYRHLYLPFRLQVNFLK